MSETIVLPEVWVLLVSAGVIPLLTSLLTKAQSSGPRHAGVAAVLSGGVTFLSQLTGGEGVSLDHLIVQFIIVLLTSAGSYISLWQPAGINDRVLPEVGI